MLNVTKTQLRSTSRDVSRNGMFTHIWNFYNTNHKQNVWHASVPADGILICTALDIHYKHTASHLHVAVREAYVKVTTEAEFLLRNVRQNKIPRAKIPV